MTGPPLTAAMSAMYGTDAPHPMDRRLMVIAICIAT
jgi:hypothetical protein